MSAAETEESARGPARNAMPVGKHTRANALQHRWSDEKEKDQSMNEINILASCNHINIVRYAGAYIVQKSLQTERILIIMEFADAGDLAMVIKRQKETAKQFLPESDVLSWFVQIAFGLQYIHKKNILHRDLKTQNIFLTSQVRIVLHDSF